MVSAASPLHGKRVLVTRTQGQARSLSDFLRHDGAVPVEVPTIEVAAPADGSGLAAAVAAIGDYDWVVFTSANGVNAFCDQLSAAGRDAGALSSSSVAAIGPGTAAALRQRGIRVDLIPVHHVGEGVVDSFRALDLRAKRILLPVAETARGAVHDGLSALGARVDRVTAYRILLPEGARATAHEAFTSGRIDAAAFVSPSAVRNLSTVLDGDLTPLAQVVIGSIGPVTSAALKDLGLHVDAEATEHTVPGLVSALRDCLARHGHG